jgi:hypothetical protein
MVSFAAMIDDIEVIVSLEAWCMHYVLSRWDTSICNPLCTEMHTMLLEMHASLVMHISSLMVQVQHIKGLHAVVCILSVDVRFRPQPTK